MEGGRAEEKIAGPLFPRLHVNDTDKGGPRAPPRNKMALYEQLSIPSQRFSSPAPASALPLPRHNASTPVPSASSSQGGGHDRGIFSPFHLSSHKSAHSTEKVHSRSSDGMNLDTCGMDIEKKSAKHTTQRTENASRHLLSAAESSSFRPHASTKDSCVKISEDEDDFRVPTFIDSRTAPYFDQDPPHVINREGPTPYYANSSQKCSAASFNSSAPLPISHDKPLERPSTTDLIPRQHEKSSVNKRAKETVTPKEDKVNTSHLETGERTAEPSNFAKESSHQGHSSCAVNALGNPELVNTRICQQSGGNGILVGPRFLDDSEVMDKGDASRMRKGSSSKISLRSNFRSQNMAENFNAESVDKVPGSSELRYTDKNDEISETSMVDSLSGFDISPDDVVGVIGPKHFWKARKAIVNQQRVFAVQVFELHRLIKVQKLIAASPHLLLEGSPYLCQSPPQALNKTLSSKCNGKSEPEISKQKDDSQRLDNNVCHVENTEGMTPLFSSEDGLGKGSAGQVPRNVPYSGNTTVPVTSDYKPGAWCLHPPGNQWLIPVLSPSEGLIYKPYAGPYPPAAGFMAPVYGGCGPLSLPPVTGDFMNTAYGVPAAHQQQNIGVYPGPPAVSPNYFPTPYGLPVVNSIVSTSAVEHVSQLAGPCPSWQAEQHSRSSCNMSKPRNEALTGCVNFQTSKGNELQGSTASSPCERVQGEGRGASPPFPIALATKGTGRPMQDHGGDHQARVIKVVPHNPRSATESAARIFRSIQRERQQCESM